MIKKETVFINGDGETSRDFCYIENCVQVNILAATTENPEAENIKPVCRDFRPGDVRHSLADISKGKKLLGYSPRFSVKDGLVGPPSVHQAVKRGWEILKNGESSAKRD